MIEEHEALRKANDKTTNLHREVRLNRATRSLLRLPGGWRVPYDVYINSFRVRRMMVILFVNDQGRVEVEWDDIAQQPGRIGELKQGLLDSSMDLPLSVVLDKVNEQHPEANIETVEPVLDIQEQNKKAALYWRVGIRQGVQRQVVLVSGLSDDNVELTSVTTSQNAARSQWTLGRVTYDDNQLQVDLKDLEGARQEHLRNQWIVWSCIASISQYMEDLKYTGLGTHNVHVEFVDFDPGTRGASFDDPNGIPTITFLRGGGWSGDRSIVLHELGHALWSLLYTRPPRPIRENDGIELNGIQEGFADYVAATLLFNGQDSVSIGQDLDEQVAQEHDLPRPVDGQPKPLPATPNRYHIGHKWANILWDFRQRLVDSSELAERVILAAHIKPIVDENAPNNTMSCYFASLQNTAARMKPDLAEWEQWDDLKQSHEIH